MKRIIRVLLLIILTLIPIRINALSVESDLISVNKMDVNVEVGNVILKNVTFVAYNNYKNTKQKGYVVNASFISSYDKTIDVKIIFKLFDSLKNPVKTYEDIYPLDNSKATLYEVGEVYPSVDSIAYYSIYLEIETDVSEPNKQEELVSDYYIDNYSSLIEIQKNREVKYNEELNVSFEHGNNYFNYFIPVKDIYVLKDLKINNEYERELEKGINNIKIGSKDGKFFNKNNLFKISYGYDLGKDYYHRNDTVDLDIVNTFSNVVKKVDFTILLPKSGEIEKIIFYLNGKEIELKHKIDGRKITGNYGSLKNDDLLSTKIIFKEGYFTNSNSIIDGWLKIGLAFPITSLLITILIFLLIRNKKIMTKEVDLELLTKYSSLEVGYLYNDKLDNKDIVSMILSLANKGYIKIGKTKKGFILNKVKDYEEDNEFEKDFLEGIFYESTTIKEEQLYYMDNSFMKDIKFNIDCKYKNKFYNNYFNKYLIMIIACYLSLFIITYRPLIVYDHTNLILGVSLSLLIFTVVFIIVNSKFRFIERVIGYLSVLVFYSFLAYFVILPALVYYCIE